MIPHATRCNLLAVTARVRWFRGCARPSSPPEFFIAAACVLFEQRNASASSKRPTASFASDDSHGELPLASKRAAGTSIQDAVPAMVKQHAGRVRQAGRCVLSWNSAGTWLERAQCGAPRMHQWRYCVLNYGCCPAALPLRARRAEPLHAPPHVQLSSPSRRSIGLQHQARAPAAAVARVGRPCCGR